MHWHELPGGECTHNLRRSECAEPVLCALSPVTCMYALSRRQTVRLLSTMAQRYFCSQVDPVTNFMSYSPDYCSMRGVRLAGETASTTGFTAGQWARMRAQTKSYKRNIFCRYSGVNDAGASCYSNSSCCSGKCVRGKCA